MTFDYMTTFCLLCYLALSGIAFIVLVWSEGGWPTPLRKKTLMTALPLLWPVLVFVVVCVAASYAVEENTDE